MIENWNLYKIYRKRAMFECPEHVSKKGGYDLDLTLEGKYTGYFRCYGCGYSGKVPMSDVEKLRKMRGEVKQEEKITDWYKYNNLCKWRRATLGILPPIDVSQFTMIKLEHGWDEKAHTFPERNADDKITGLLRRFPDRKKGVVSSSKRGIYIPRINFDSSKKLYITEGLSDLAVILECGFQGIGRSNCNANTEEVIHWLCLHCSDKTNIVIVADNDEPGIIGANELYNSLRAVNTEDGKKVFYIDVITPPASDLYSLYEELGLERTKKWLLE